MATPGWVTEKYLTDYRKFPIWMSNCFNLTETGKNDKRKLEPERCRLWCTGQS